MSITVFTRSLGLCDFRTLPVAGRSRNSSRSSPNSSRSHRSSIPHPTCPRPWPPNQPGPGPAPGPTLVTVLSWNVRPRPPALGQCPVVDEFLSSRDFGHRFGRSSLVTRRLVGDDLGDDGGSVRLWCRPSWCRPVVSRPARRPAVRATQSARQPARRASPDRPPPGAPSVPPGCDRLPCSCPLMTRLLRLGLGRADRSIRSLRMPPDALAVEATGPLRKLDFIRRVTNPYRRTSAPTGVHEFGQNGNAHVELIGRRRSSTAQRQGTPPLPAAVSRPPERTMVALDDVAHEPQSEPRTGSVRASACGGPLETSSRFPLAIPYRDP